MDPLTVLAVAKGSYEAIKAGIKVGKEIQGMLGDVSQLWGSVAKLTQLAADPPRAGLFAKKSTEQIAIDAFTAKKQAEEWEAEIRNSIVAQYGLKGWDEIQREITRIKKQQKLLAIQAQREQEQFLDDLKLLGSVIFGGFFLVALLVSVAIIIH